MIVNTTFTARGDADPRVAELQEVAQAVGMQGMRLSIAISIALFYEDQGLVYDFRTGLAVALVDDRGMEEVFQATRSGFAVNYLLTPVTDEDVEETINGLFTATSEQCAPDGTLQQVIDAGYEPPTREQRQDEAAYLYDAAAHYDRRKRETTDYEDDMLDREFWSRGMW